MRHLLFILFLGCALPLPAGDWPSWRGPQGSGIAQEPTTLSKWSARENVVWKTPLPEEGNSSPIVWKDRIFLTQALKKENRRTLMCLDRKTGKVLWQVGEVYQDEEPSHQTNPYCSSSPVTDGQVVIAYFGSAGLHAYDFSGKKLWAYETGPFRHEWGYAASPILYQDLCILNVGPSTKTTLLAVNKKSGKKIWENTIPESKPSTRTDGFAGQRDGMIGSWSTPILVKAGNRDELVMSYPEYVIAYDPSTGKEWWRCAGLNPLVYTSPIAGDGIIVAMGGFLGTTIAVKAGGSGDVTSTHRLWQTPRTKNRLGSGVIVGKHVFILNTEGIAECLELQTGKVLWQERLKGKGAKGESWSSMVAVGDKIYIPNQSGDMFILKAAPQFEILGINSIDGELTNSSPAFSDGQIFIRTHNALWCLGNPS